MSTLPPTTFEGHIQNLLERLRSRVPVIDTMPLRFYDSHDVERKQGQWLLADSMLKDLDAMRILFERLCQEGREWVHFAGEGATQQGEYLISVDYSQTTGHPVTFINLAGPTLNSNGSVQNMADVHIISEHNSEE